MAEVVVIGDGLSSIVVVILFAVTIVISMIITILIVTNFKCRVDATADLIQVSICRHRHFVPFIKPFAVADLGSIADCRASSRAAFSSRGTSI